LPVFMSPRLIGPCYKQMLKNFWVLGADPFFIDPRLPDNLGRQNRFSGSPSRPSVQTVCHEFPPLLLIIELNDGSPKPRLFLLLMEYQNPNFSRTGLIGISPSSGTFVITSTEKTVSTFWAASLRIFKASGSFSSLHFPSMMARSRFFHWAHHPGAFRWSYPT